MQLATNHVAVRCMTVALLVFGVPLYAITACAVCIWLRAFEDQSCLYVKSVALTCISVYFNSQR